MKNLKEFHVISLYKKSWCSGMRLIDFNRILIFPKVVRYSTVNIKNLHVEKGEQQAYEYTDQIIQEPNCQSKVPILKTLQMQSDDS